MATKKPKQQRLFHTLANKNKPRQVFSMQYLCWTLKPSKKEDGVPLSYGVHQRDYKGAEKQVKKRILAMLHKAGPSKRTFKYEVVKFMGSQFISWDLVAIAKDPTGIHYPNVEDTLLKVDELMSEIENELIAAGYSYPEWLFILRTYNRRQKSSKNPFEGLDFLKRG